MNTVPNSSHCPKCQAPLPADAPQGLCAKCLLAAVAAPTEADLPGDTRAAPPLDAIAAAFPQLEIVELIGQGGMGAVYQARQPKLDRFVALKILPQSLAAEPAFAERFNREARVLARLNHPNIVTVYDFGVVAGILPAIDVAAGFQPAVEPGFQPGGPGQKSSMPVENSETTASSTAGPGGKMPPSTSGRMPDATVPTQFYYILMEFVDGVNLRQAMKVGRFTPAQALAVVPKICEALQFAHNEGILHRDIKPENILLDTKGRVKIADFGIAKLVGGRDALPRVQADPQVGPTNLTKTGQTLGTPNYMAPEQLAHPQDVDQRADIYSLGVVFYEMLTGELPLGRFAPPSEKSAVDPRVDEVVLRALEKERGKRFRTAGEVKTQVETIAATPPAGSSRREEAQTESGNQNTEAQPPSRSRVVLRSSVIALLVFLLVFAAAAVVASLLPRTYAGVARVQLTSTNSAVRADDSYRLQNELALLESPGFLKQVAEKADLRTRWKDVLFGNENEQAEQLAVRLRGAMQLKLPRGTDLIEIQFYSESPADVAEIANAIATTFCEWPPQPHAILFDKAETPNHSMRSHAALASAALTLAIGAVLGGLLGVLAGLLTAFLSRWKSRPTSPARSSRREEAQTEGGKLQAPRSSRTAIVGVCFGILGVLALVVYAVIGDSNLLDEGPSDVLAASGIMCFLLSTILGWVAVSQIRRSAGKLHGMWLAVSDGLLFPLLALNGLLAFQASTIVETFSAIDAVLTQLSIQPASDERLKWVAGIATVFICAVSNTLIAWGVWRAVNKTSAGVPPAVPENSCFGKWACGPLLVGTLGPSLVLTIVPWQEGWAEGLAAAIGSAALALTLVWGLISWRQRLGKFVVIATSALLAVVIVIAAVLSLVIIPAKRARLQSAFGPVTQCTLPMDEDGWTPLFDLDHNQPVPDPKPGHTAGNRAQHLAQLKKPGVAIHHDGQTHVIAVSGITIRYTDGDGDQWERITDIDTLVAFSSGTVTGPGSWQTCDFPGKLPPTIFFKTSVTKLGLLQIAGFTDKPRAVKIRYKLVQTSQPPASVQPKTNPAHPDSAPTNNTPTVDAGLEEFRAALKVLRTVSASDPLDHEPTRRMLIKRLDAQANNLDESQAKKLRAKLEEFYTCYSHTEFSNYQRLKLRQPFTIGKDLQAYLTDDVAKKGIPVPASDEDKVQLAWMLLNGTNRITHIDANSAVMYVFRSPSFDMSFLRFSIALLPSAAHLCWEDYVVNSPTFDELSSQGEPVTWFWVEQFIRCNGRFDAVPNALKLIGYWDPKNSDWVLWKFCTLFSMNYSTLF